METINLKLEKYNCWVDEIINDNAIITWHKIFDKSMTIFKLHKIARVVFLENPTINKVYTHFGVFTRKNRR